MDDPKLNGATVKTVGELIVAHENGGKAYISPKGIFHTKQQTAPVYGDKRRLEPRRVAKCYQLYLGDAKEAEVYDEILNLCANGFGRIVNRKVEDDPERKSWRVLVEVIWSYHAVVRG